MGNPVMQRVRCISVRKSNQSQIEIGKEYLLDQNSIWIDQDGDAYGNVFDGLMNRIGQMKLSHFCSVGTR